MRASRAGGTPSSSSLGRTVIKIPNMPPSTPAPASPYNTRSSARKQAAAAAENPSMDRKMKIRRLQKELTFMSRCGHTHQSHSRTRCHFYLSVFSNSRATHAVCTPSSALFSHPHPIVIMRLALVNIVIGLERHYYSQGVRLDRLFGPLYPRYLVVKFRARFTLLLVPFKPRLINFVIIG